MTERRPFVVGNWKMNGTTASAHALVRDILQGLTEPTPAQVVVCPPYILIPKVVEQLAGTSVACGAQDIAQYSNGAYTGEVSAEMIKDSGCQYVILGHSERRTLYGETSEVVAHKFVRARRENLIPILCVGETLEEREQRQTEAVIRAQLDAVTDTAGIEALQTAIIAYEPVWAIGTGKTATPDQAQDVHKFIREYLSRLDSYIAQTIRILYGGSVKADNARGLFEQSDIDGGLIGGASLQAKDFLSICQAA